MTVTQEQASEAASMTELLAREQQLWSEHTVVCARWRECVGTYAEMWCRAVAMEPGADADRLARAAWAVHDWADVWKQRKDVTWRKWYTASEALSEAFARQCAGSRASEPSGS